MTCIILHYRKWQAWSTDCLHSQGCDFSYVSVINGLVMEYKFPTECCNLPTNLVLSAIYCQVVGAAEISTAQSSPRYRGEGAEAAGQHEVQLGRTVTISCWHQRALWGLWKGAAPMAGTKETLRNHTLGNITTGMSYFKDMSALKMPNPSSHFEVFLWDVFAHTHTRHQ